jgi:transcriptional regulator with XRE-family HTH domain
MVKIRAREKRAAEVAKNLSALLLETGMSQADVSRATGIPRDAFGRYLHGINLPPARKVAKIAATFGCSPHRIDPSLPEDLSLPAGPDPSSPLFSVGRGTSEGRLRIKMDTELPSELVMKIARVVAENGGEAPQEAPVDPGPTEMEP